MKTLFFASENRGKTLEMHKLLAGLAQVKNITDLKIPVTWEETGATFLANAQIKAHSLWQLIKEPVFADDSGLCVEALNGEPGVYSARWAGDSATDAMNRSKLLSALKDYPDEKLRRAYFICCIVYINEKNEEFVFEGRLNGKITHSERGSRGFGYDSVFVPEGYDKTLAELSLEEKNKLSHRAIAVQKLCKFLSLS